MSKNKEQRIKAAKKEVKTIDLILTGIFIFLIAFVITMIVVAYTLSYEPSTLIASVFAFCGLECGLLASITKRKAALKQEVERLSEDTSVPLVFDEIDNTNNDFIDDTIYDKYNTYNTYNQESYLNDDTFLSNTMCDTSLYCNTQIESEESFDDLDLLPIDFDEEF